MPGIDHAPAVGDNERIVGEIEEFLTGSRSEVEIDRVLATVLFTAVVDSTSGPQSSATVDGALCLTSMTRPCGNGSRASAVVK